MDRHIDWRELNVNVYGLQPSLTVPIAAASVEAIASYVGTIEKTIVGRAGRVNAVLVRTTRPSLSHDAIAVPLWAEPEAESNWERIHPRDQVWVHVDHDGYRQSWRELGMADPGRLLLDHVQNRWYTRGSAQWNPDKVPWHPFLRLVPVSRGVNVSGGARTGGEGMATDFMERFNSYSAEIQEIAIQALRAPIVLADPMDLTKMLNLLPGAADLQGVAQTQDRFFGKQP